MDRLQGKAVIVTGASKGIGRAIALRCAAEGARLLATYNSDRDGGERTVAAIRDAGGEAQALCVDVAKKQDNEAMAAEALRLFGRIDVLCANAGIFPDRLELGKYNITVNSVEPGVVKSEGLADQVGNAKLDAVREDTPLKIIATPTDIAHAVLFLASDEARAITGQSIVVDGGLLRPEASQRLLE